MNGVKDIFQREEIFLIDDDFYLIFGDVSLLSVPLYKLPCFIWRGVVDINDVIVLVLLHENRV
jgi:hypothetical protein